MLRDRRTATSVDTVAEGGLTRGTLRGGRERRPLVDGRFWVALLVLTLVLAALVPLLWDDRYFFRGDTQNAYLGWWYHLGSEVRRGHLPLLDLSSWRAGNFIAEGQWGLFSPLTILIGVAATFVSDLVLFVTAVKIAIIVGAGCGVYLLTRSYGVHRAGAYVAGVLVPLCGEAQVLEWPSWVTGQMSAALMPWCWWALRRTMLRGANPWPALLTGYLIVSIGYVYGTIYLGVVLVGCVGECLLRRQLRGAWRVVLVGLVSALIAVTVYLPGVLTAPVTGRAGWAVVANGSMTADAGGLLTSFLPLGPLHGGITSTLYVAWILPMVLWVDWSRVRKSASELSGLVVVIGLMLMWLLGPGQIGPLRWPLRTMPALALGVVVLCVVLLHRGVVRPPSGRRLALSLLATLAAGYVAFWVGADYQRVVVSGTGLVLVGTVLVWMALRLRANGTVHATGVAAAAALVGIWSVGPVALQHHQQPIPPAVDRHSPRFIEGYQNQLAQAQGDVMVMGDPELASVRNPRVSRSLLVAAAWYLNPHPVQNTYTTIKFKAYDSAWCMRYNGSTMCRGALHRLRQTEPETGQPWLDLLSVSTVAIFKTSFARAAWAHPPAGWHLVDVDRFTAMWLRDRPLPTAGGVAWTSPGVRVSDVRSSDRDLVFDVDRVPESGGRVVLSRLAWPGYEVSGASLAAPVSERLLSVEVPAGSDGRTVRVHWSPPGWTVEVLCWWLGVLLGVGWSVLVALRRRGGRWRRASRTLGRLSRERRV